MYHMLCGSRNWNFQRGGGGDGYGYFLEQHMYEKNNDSLYSVKKWCYTYVMFCFILLFFSSSINVFHFSHVMPFSLLQFLLELVHLYQENHSQTLNSDAICI